MRTSLFTSIFMCFAAIAALAQNEANIEVGYSSLSPNLKNGNVEIRHQYILLANADESKFYSPKTEYIDSLNSTPEGKAVYNEMALGAYFGGKMKEMPRKDGDCYVLKSFNDNVCRSYEVAGLDKFVYDEALEEWHWEITDSTKEILGYECFKAMTDYHGRRWTVWFTPEIPLQNGPWKLGGLPGLILKAAADDGQYSFVATGIQQTDKPVTQVYLADEYEKTTRMDFLKNKRSFMDNTISRLNAQLSGISITKVEDENGNDISGAIFASRKKVDFIEKDY
ncbi:MAG: GLPGLI family protein [Paramuribaculum sp.]|nr:GLPGLI family protein [Paramuribaculum sp.]